MNKPVTPQSVGLSREDLPNSYIGRSVPRSNVRKLVQGRATYTDDVSLPRLVHAAFVRSPHAHARVKGIDASEAEAMEGVIAVLNGRQLTGDGIGNLICGWAISSKDGSPMNMGPWSALATDRVRYVGFAIRGWPHWLI